MCAENEQKLLSAALPQSAVDTEDKFVLFVSVSPRR